VRASSGALPCACLGIWLHRHRSCTPALAATRRIVPGNVAGSPAYDHGALHVLLAVVHRYGLPTLFLTPTAYRINDIMNGIVTLYRDIDASKKVTTATGYIVNGDLTEFYQASGLHAGLKDKWGGSTSIAAPMARQLVRGFRSLCVVVLAKQAVCPQVC
jgi:hypothetical protein